jgi:hypothetical protein
MGRLLRVKSQGGVFTTAYRRGPEVFFEEVWNILSPRFGALLVEPFGASWDEAEKLSH